MPEGVGQKIRIWREENESSRKMFADLLNYSEKAVQNWENGTALPSFDAIISVAKLMGVSIDWLLGQTNTWKTADAVMAEKPQMIPVLGEVR